MTQQPVAFKLDVACRRHRPHHHFSIAVNYLDRQDQSNSKGFADNLRRFDSLQMLKSMQLQFDGMARGKKPTRHLIIRGLR